MSRRRDPANRCRQGVNAPSRQRGTRRTRLRSRGHQRFSPAGSVCSTQPRVIHLERAFRRLQGPARAAQREQRGLPAPRRRGTNRHDLSFASYRRRKSRSGDGGFTVPESARSRPNSTRMVVDSPDPFGPRKRCALPAWTRRSKPCTGGNFPKDLVSPCTSATEVTAPTGTSPRPTVIHTGQPTRSLGSSRQQQEEFPGNSRMTRNYTDVILHRNVHSLWITLGRGSTERRGGESATCTA